MAFRTSKVTAPTRTASANYTPAQGPTIQSVTTAFRALSTVNVVVDSYVSPVSVTVNGIAQADVVEVDATNISFTLRNAGVPFNTNVDLVITDANGAGAAFNLQYQPPAGFGFDPLVNTIADLTNQNVVDGDIFAYETSVTTSHGTYDITHNGDGTLSTATAGAPEGLRVQVFTQDADGTPNYALSNIVEVRLGTNHAPQFGTPIPDYTFAVGETVSIDLSSLITDQNVGDRFTYAMSPQTVGGLSIPDNLTGTISGIATETALTAITVTVTDEAGLTTQDTFDLVVNQPALQVLGLDDSQLGAESEIINFLLNIPFDETLRAASTGTTYAKITSTANLTSVVLGGVDLSSSINVIDGQIFSFDIPLSIALGFSNTTLDLQITTAEGTATLEDRAIVVSDNYGLFSHRKLEAAGSVDVTVADLYWLAGIEAGDDLIYQAQVAFSGGAQVDNDAFFANRRAISDSGATPIFDEVFEVGVFTSGLSVVSQGGGSTPCPYPALIKCWLRDASNSYQLLTYAQEQEYFYNASVTPISNISLSQFVSQDIEAQFTVNASAQVTNFYYSNPRALSGLFFDGVEQSPNTTRKNVANGTVVTVIFAAPSTAGQTEQYNFTVGDQTFTVDVTAIEIPEITEYTNAIAYGEVSSQIHVEFEQKEYLQTYGETIVSNANSIETKTFGVSYSDVSAIVQVPIEQKAYTSQGEQILTLVAVPFEPKEYEQTVENITNLVVIEHEQGVAAKAYENVVPLVFTQHTQKAYSVEYGFIASEREVAEHAEKLYSVGLSEVTSAVIVGFDAYEYEQQINEILGQYIPQTFTVNPSRFVIF